MTLTPSTTQEYTKFFTKEIWTNLVHMISASFRLSELEQERLFESRTARLIGALPYLARCDQSERTALSHIAIYLLSIKNGTRQAFDHQPEDNKELHIRLERILHFMGGEPTILRRGILLLTLQMVAGYSRDLEKDHSNNEYNPVLAGRWDAGSIMEELHRQLESIPSADMDTIMTVEHAKTNWWS